MIFLFDRLTLAGKVWTTYFILLIAVWFAFCGAALAHTEKHGQPVKETPQLLNMPPDNWGGAKAHVLMFTGFGVVTSYAADSLKIDPSYKLPVAFGVCMLPGLYREWNTYENKPEPGYRHGLFSRNDIKANAIGCGLGMLSYRGIRAIVTPRGSSLVIDRTF